MKKSKRKLSDAQKLAKTYTPEVLALFDVNQGNHEKYMQGEERVSDYEAEHGKFPKLFRAKLVSRLTEIYAHARRLQTEFKLAQEAGHIAGESANNAAFIRGDQYKDKPSPGPVPPAGPFKPSPELKESSAEALVRSVTSINKHTDDFVEKIKVATLESDKVNHPTHYNEGKIEVIEFLEDKKLGFHLGNAVKYIARAGKKDPCKTVEDLEKAIWYIRRQIALEKNREDAIPVPRPNSMPQVRAQ